MSKRKKLLGLLMAVGMSVSTCVTPVLAETASILDEITEEETTEDFSEDTSYSLLRGTNLNFGNVKIQRVDSDELHSVIRNVKNCICHFIWNVK